MEIARERFLNQLIELKGNGNCKLVYGIRFCGRTHLLRTFMNHLLADGVSKSQILAYELGAWNLAHLTDGARLLENLESRITTGETYTIILDDFHLIRHPEIVLQALTAKKNLDIYLSTSNTALLKADYLQWFSGVDFVPLYPISYREYQAFCHHSDDAVWKAYVTYGGMPFILTKWTAEEKEQYLISLTESCYVPDIADRHHIRNQQKLDNMLHTLAAHTGTSTTYLQLSQTMSLSSATFKKHEQYLEDAFLVNKAARYDIRKQRYFDSQAKFYFADHGICNAYLQFDSKNKSRLVETIVYNELLQRGFSVDTGVLEFFTKDKYQSTIRNRQNLDFIAHRGKTDWLIQLAASESDFQQKYETLVRIRQPYQKKILCTDTIPAHTDLPGITVQNVRDFLLSDTV